MDADLETINLDAKRDGYVDSGLLIILSSHYQSAKVEKTSSPLHFALFKYKSNVICTVCLYIKITKIEMKLMWQMSSVKNICHISTSSVCIIFLCIKFVHTALFVNLNIYIPY